MDIFRRTDQKHNNHRTTRRALRAELRTMSPEELFADLQPYTDLGPTCDLCPQCQVAVMPAETKCPTCGAIL